MIELMRVNEGNQSEWLDLRRRTVGSSDIAAISGLFPWRSPLQVWMEKTGKIDPQPENDDLFIGKEAEFLVSRMFNRRHPELQPITAQVLCAHDEYPYATCTTDFWLYDKFTRESADLLHLSERPIGLLETKFQKIQALAAWEDGVVTHHLLQTNWQLGITGLPSAWVASLVGGFNYREAPIQPDSRIFGHLIELASKFMELVEKDIPPNAGPGDRNSIRELFEQKAGEVVVFDATETQELLQKWESEKTLLATLEDAAKEKKDSVKAIENNLMLMMKGAGKGLSTFRDREEKDWHVEMVAKTISKKSFIMPASSYVKFNVKFLEED